MAKIICPCEECIHNGERFVCTAKKINLKWRNMLTVNEGRVDMRICDKYKMTEQAVQMEKAFGEYIKTIQSDNHVL